MTLICDHTIQPKEMIKPEMELNTIVLNLYEDDNSLLYTGSSVKFVDHLIWFTEHPSISKDAFSDMLRIQHFSILPKDNLLPCLYNDLTKMVTPLPCEACGV